MIDRPGAALGMRREADQVVVVDRSCGRCVACARGASLWCLQPTEDGRDLAPGMSESGAAALTAALTAAAAFKEAPTTSTALVVDEEDGALALLVRALCPARVLVSPDPFRASLKARLAELEPTGRAAVIVAGSDARAAVKAVRRGGHVCVGDLGALMPSVTELVQREVTLLGPRDVTGTIRRVGHEVWSAVVAAAA